MAPRLPRTHINSSRLVRCLADLSALDGPAAPASAGSGEGFADHLGRWLNWTDAIALSAALQGGATPKPAAAAGMPAASSRAVEAFHSVRDALTRAIGAGLAADGPVADDATADFAPYRQHHLQQQRAMEAGIAPLRRQVRAALASASPAGARLAALDAVLADALATRERHLLAGLPAWLERHFERLQRGAAETPADSPPDVPPDTPPNAPAGWRSALDTTLQGLLLAELDLRLQPIEGMLEALVTETTKRP